MAKIEIIAHIAFTGFDHARVFREIPEVVPSVVPSIVPGVVPSVEERPAPSSADPAPASVGKGAPVSLYRTLKPKCPCFL